MERRLYERTSVDNRLIARGRERVDYTVTYSTLHYCNHCPSGEMRGAKDGVKPVCSSLNE